MMMDFNRKNALVPMVIEQTGHGERSFDIFLKDKLYPMTQQFHS